MLLLAFALLTCANGAWAWADCRGGGSTVTVALPSTISVPRNAVPGTVLVPWRTTGWVSYFCDQSGSDTGILAMTLLSGTDFPGTLPGSALGGEGSSDNYRVLQTQVPGIGIAIAFNAYPNLCTPGWVDLFNPFPSIAPWDGWQCNAGGNDLVNKGQFAVAIVTTGTVSAGTLPAQTIAKTAGVIGNIPASGTSAHYLNMPQVQIVPMTCETPDVPVYLGKHFTNALGNIGSTTPPVEFNISLNNCPAGMNTIRYRIDPTTTVIDGTQSVVALSDIPGSATGIGVQLLDGAGAALKLQSTATFHGYNRTTGGSYTIPMKARYYKTGTNVTPGPANTAMTVTMSYQ